MQTERKVFEKLFTSDKVELESHKFEFKLDPVAETKIIDDLFKRGADVRFSAFSEAANKINAVLKDMNGKRSALYRDMQDFSSSYEKLIGQKADNTDQVKAYKKSIERADIQIKDLTDSVGELNRLK